MGDSVCKIPFRNRQGEVRGYALVDPEDFEWASQYKWYAINGEYAARHHFDEHRNHTVLLLHREILGLEKGDKRVGDHINRNTLDDRRSNLRILPHNGFNAHNRSSYRNTSSRYRGVSWNKEINKWTSCLQVGGRAISLGTFVSEIEAAVIVDYARQQLLTYAVGQTDGLAPPDYRIPESVLAKIRQLKEQGVTA